MVYKTSGKAFTILVCIVIMTLIFSACSFKKEKNASDTPVQTKALSWIVSPGIEAQGVEPLVRADFNENTKHYDISYADCFRIMIDGKYGIIDLNGEIVVPAEYDGIFAIRNSNDFLGIKKTGSEKAQKYIHSDTFETESAYKTYNSIKYEYYWDAGSRKAVFVKNSDGSITENTIKSVLPETVKAVNIADGKYNETGFYGLYSNGNLVTGSIYTGAGCFTNGIAAFKSNGVWGYVDSSGKTVIPFGYDAVEGYSALGGEDTPYESYDGYVTVCKDGKFGILLSNGTAVTDTVYEAATPVVNGKAFARENGKWGILLVSNDEQSDSSVSTEISKTSTSTSEITSKTTTTKTSETEKSTSKTTTTTSDTGSYRISIDEGGILNLRSGAGTENEIVASLGANAVVYVDRVSNGWGHTVYNGKEGWFNMKYAEKY